MRIREPQPRLIATIDDGQPASDGGGAPSAEPTAPTEPAAPAAPPPDPQGEKRFSQAEVDRIIAERLARERAKAAPTGKREATSPKQEVPSNGVDGLAAQRFDRVAARYGLTDKQIDLLFPQYAQESPGDTAAWVASRVEELGLKTQSATPSPPRQDVAPAAPTAQIPPGAPAPRKVDPLHSGEFLDLLSLSEEELDRLGPRGIVSEFEKTLREAHARSGAPPMPHLRKR